MDGNKTPINLLAVLIPVLIFCGCQQENNVKVTLLLDSPTYTPGDSILFTLRLENSSSDTIFALTPTTQLFDILMYSAKGEKIWQWSSGRFFAQVITKEAFPPSTKEIKTLFTGKLKNGNYLKLGKYTAYAYILVKPKLVTKPITFWVVD